jgi:CrcB protein
MTVFLVSIFGSIGCVVRYLMEYAVRRHHPTRRPWATVAANALGCMIGAFIAYKLLAGTDARWHDMVLTGFCGGLTTFSSAFAIPALLQQEHHWRYSLALVLTTPLLCAGFFAIGMQLAR